MTIEHPGEQFVSRGIWSIRIVKACALVWRKVFDGVQGIVEHSPGNLGWARVRRKPKLRLR